MTLGGRDETMLRKEVGCKEKEGERSSSSEAEHSHLSLPPLLMDLESRVMRL